MDSSRGPGGASRVSGGRDEEPRSQSSTGRWIPPALRRDALAQESPHNNTFRKVRGILNKLTPENFKKLSSDLLQVDLTSEIVLKGVIFLIFEKALEEPKYSSMYAKLCKCLNEEVSKSITSEVAKPTIFEILLANNCRSEFYNRSKITEGLEKSAIVTPEDEEKLQIAKRKMLGNIRFIGELGKLGVVADSTLHRCIYQLLQRIRKNHGKDKVEDMECLCQIMRTCGRILDSDKGQNFMNQYFERMEKLSKETETPQRIRFMLQDVIELRKANWVPRKATSTEGPMPIAQIIDVEQSNNGSVVFKSLLAGQLSGQRGSFMNQQSSNDLFRRPLKMREDMLSSPFPSPHPSHDKFSSYNLNGFNSGGLGFRNQGRQNHFISSSMGNSMQSAHQPNYYQNRSNYNNNQHNNNNNNSTSNTNKDLAPRFKKLLQQGSNLEDVSLRPPANSMICKPPNTIKSSSTMTNARPSSLMTEPIMVPPPIKAPPVLQTAKDPVILIKPTANDKNKTNKKEKSLSKEEMLKKVSSIAKTLAENNNVEESVINYRELKIADHLVPEAINTVLSHLICKTENNEELAAKFIGALKKGNNLLSAQQFLKCFKTLLNSMSNKDNAFNFIGKVAGLAGHLITFEENLLKLNTVAELSENGKHYPLCILTLQVLSKVMGKSKLTQLFNESKINLLNTLPEADRTKERLGEILDEYELTFLIPLLRIQAELWKQVQADPNPSQLYKWIKESLDPAHHSDPGFINALVTVLVKYITETMLAEGLDSNQVPDKVAQDKEKQLLEKFKPILQAFLHERVDLQVIAVYALQVHCYSHDFPKGMLLRWFNNFYNFEIVEEEAFLKWREDDVSDCYPGKGKALFQVNNWLTWLAEAEEEEEEEEEEDEEEDEVVEELGKV